MLAVRVLASSSDGHNRDELAIIVDMVDHTPVANSDAPAFQSTQLATSHWARVILQLKDRCRNATKVRFVNTIQLAVRSTIEEFDPILVHRRLCAESDSHERFDALHRSDE